MNAPFLNTEVIGLDFGLVITVLLGIGFGFFLERGGFGSSRKLAAQFYFYDMTVFKVMFSAILTAMIGLFGLAKLGFIDLDLTYINETYIWPQLIGGFLLGIGFIISGYCPGTGLVAMVSGKIDALVAVGGIVFGIFLFGVTYTPAVAEFHTSGYHGRLLLSDLLGIEPTLLAAGITVMAVALFFGAEWVEKRFQGEGRQISETYVPKIRYASFAVLIIAALLFALPFGPNAPVAEAYTPTETISPMAVAKKLVEKDGSVTVIDLRTSISEQERIPGAYPALRDEDTGDPAWSQMLMDHHVYVLVTEDGNGEAIELPRKFNVRMMAGGFEGWKADILTKPELAENASAEEEDSFRIRSAFYAYFTGAALEAPKSTTPPPTFKASAGKKKKPAGGC